MESGQSLGPYKIVERLGAGGMGEVFLAEDTRLGRTVAVKVLPAEFASEPERLARFEQEARAAAALNHPHIAAVYDVGVEGETQFMVQEHLQGRTLREAMAERAVDLPTALELGTQIAEGLRAAHAAGIIHRDLKPDNIFVSAEGHAKILDFGLAKLTEMAMTASPGAEATKSPTMLGTVAGQVMGTAGYMAPEQVEGSVEIDGRSDLFAFGCVLYEMVTGKQPFAGRNVYDTLSRIVDQEPTPVTEMDGELPAQLQWIVRKCLAKAPNRRYQGAGDLAVDLKALSADLASGTALPAAGSAAEGGEPAPTGAGSRLLVSVAGVALLLGVLGTWMATRPEPPAPDAVRRFSLSIPEGQRLTGNTHPIALSPDGRNLVRLAIRGSERWLELRRLDQLAGNEIPGTRGVSGEPFFSPDGRWLAFDMNNRLMRVSLSGEPPQTLCEVDTLRGAAWTESDGIIFSDNGVLYRVAAAGGTPQPVPTTGEETRLTWPAALPTAGTVLVTSGAAGAEATSIELLDLASGERSLLVAGGTAPSWVDTGHLVYARDGFLFAVAFDLASGVVSGEPFPVLEQVHEGARGEAHYAVARDGTLVHAPARGGSGDAFTASLVWMRFDGQVTPTAVAPAAFNDARLSPDGRRIAAQVGAIATGAEIYVYALDQGGAGQRLTSTGDNVDPLWTPDGEWIIFSSLRTGDGDLYRQRADFSGDAELLLERAGRQLPYTISADGRLLGFAEFGGQAVQIGVLDLESGQARLVAESEFGRFLPALAPDGRHLAFVGLDTGGREVYLLELDSGRRSPVSNAGGSSPMWAPGGDRIYFESRDSELWAVDADLDDGMRISEPFLVTEAGRRLELEQVAPDGERALGISLDDPGDGAAPFYELVVTLGWFEEIRQRAESAR